MDLWPLAEWMEMRVCTGRCPEEGMYVVRAACNQVGGCDLMDGQIVWLSPVLKVL